MMMTSLTLGQFSGWLKTEMYTDVAKHSRHNFTACAVVNTLLYKRCVLSIRRGDFTARHHMQSAVLAIVNPSVRLSVTRWHVSKRLKI